MVQRGEEGEGEEASGEGGLQHLMRSLDIAEHLHVLQVYTIALALSSTSHNLPESHPFFNWDWHSVDWNHNNAGWINYVTCSSC